MITVWDALNILRGVLKNPMNIKADQPHPRNYPHTPTNYRHTDNYLRLVTVVVALCCTRQSRASNIDRCGPEFDFDLDP